MTNSCEDCKYYDPIYWKEISLKECQRDARFTIGCSRFETIRVKTMIPYANNIKALCNWCRYQNVIVATPGDCKVKK